MSDRAILIRVLEESCGNLTETARVLGLSCAVLRSSLKRAGIEYESKRGRIKTTFPIDIAQDLHDRGISYRKIADILEVLGYRVGYGIIRRRLMKKS